jgi:hypothetical protein
MKIGGTVAPRTAGDVRFDAGKFLASLGRWLEDWDGSVQRHGERLRFERVRLPRHRPFLFLAGEVSIESTADPVRVRYSLDLKWPLLVLGGIVAGFSAYEAWRRPDLRTLPCLIVAAGYLIVLETTLVVVFLLWFRRAIRRIAWDSTNRPD